MDVGELVGSFVIEVGVRQAWPFIGFCDNRDALSKETRLYVDAPWAIDGEAGGSPADTERWLSAVDSLNGLTVSAAQVEGAGLRLDLADGSYVTASGEAASETVGEPWWFEPWRQ